MTSRAAGEGMSRTRFDQKHDLVAELLDKVRAVFVFNVAAYNLVRLAKLLAPTGELTA